MSLAKIRNAWPTAPQAIQEEVELWARESGRHAKMHFAPPGTWFIRLSLKSTDKRMKLFQMGLSAEPPGEDVWLHTSNPHEGKVISGVRQGPYIPLSLEELGTSGVREFLQKGDTWSGRGKYLSMIDQIRQVNTTNEDARVKARADAKEASRYEQRDKRRWRFKIPFLPVGIDLRGDKSAKEGAAE
jgi:hypothetical protein